MHTLLIYNNKKP